MNPFLEPARKGAKGEQKPVDPGAGSFFGILFLALGQGSCLKTVLAFLGAD